MGRAPSVDLGADITINQGDTLTRNGSFVDPGADVWTAFVDYGDGTGVQALTLNADKTFELNHEYLIHGTYAVAVNVADEDDGLGADSLTVTVLSAQEQINLIVDDIHALVDSGMLNGGEGNSLTSKLDGAVDKLDEGKTNAGVNKLEAFVNQINALVNSSRLTQEEGQTLVDAASAAINSALLGSPLRVSQAGTAYDHVDAVMTEWDSEQSYRKGVANSNRAGSALRPDNSYYLIAGDRADMDPLAFGDGIKDTLKGRHGLDWFLTNEFDDKTDMEHILTQILGEFNTSF